MVPSHRLPGYKGSLIHHASNPPKRRMGGPVGGGAMGVASMSVHQAKPHPGMLRNQPQRKEREQPKAVGRNWKMDDGRVSEQSDRSKEEERVSPDHGDKDSSEEKAAQAGKKEGSVKTAEGVAKKSVTQEDIRRSASEGNWRAESSKKADSSGRAQSSGRAEEVTRSSSSYSFTTLQPPPASKSSKNKGGHAPSSQSQVQSGGTTYFYSGQQVKGEVCVCVCVCVCLSVCIHVTVCQLASVH